jgi:hypothetical protein
MMEQSGAKAPFILGHIHRAEARCFYPNAPLINPLYQAVIS